ncbi:hypothetical protein AMTRI_Chr07g30580 [Amborella trichopoda]|uniref:PAR1 protein n=1 Tax=Amborella trichopoda TaxID=13333 RepID=W1NHW7_AMBTC|nr:uncharacterized protein LOC18422894 [Amborella trichopoda]ERM95083.1 hypothetical protein AMTR_s00009p00254330 [Amborella trichopoda]|eukprot:XP_006827667.1 uncharacterized protein LOC18422894 [Amborella trichopoda]
MAFYAALRTSVAMLMMLVVTIQHTSATAKIVCEQLHKDKCAFSVSSSGTRCVLEQRMTHSTSTEYECKASEIAAAHLSNWIETDKCLEACGLNRNMVGISSDFLLEPQFVKKLCATQCYHGCPNILNLYFNLAAGEGVYLPKLCEAQRASSRRAMAEIRSSGLAAAPEASIPAEIQGALPPLPSSS